MLKLRLPCAPWRSGPSTLRPADAGVIILPRHERCIRTGQEVDHRGDFLRRAGTVHGDALGHVVDLGLGQLLKDFRADYGGGPRR